MSRKDDTQVVVESNTELKEPEMFRVLLVNDDYTTMEFVVLVLNSIFHMTSTQAEDIMLKIHHQGRGICGVFSYEVAEMKVTTVIEMARQHEYPLLCVMEEDR